MPKHCQKYEYELSCALDSLDIKQIGMWSKYWKEWKIWLQWDHSIIASFLKLAKPVQTNQTESESGSSSSNWDCFNSD